MAKFEETRKRNEKPNPTGLLTSNNAVLMSPTACVMGVLYVDINPILDETRSRSRDRGRGEKTKEKGRAQILYGEHKGTNSTRQFGEGIVGCFGLQFHELGEGIQLVMMRTDGTTERQRRKTQPMTSNRGKRRKDHLSRNRHSWCDSLDEGFIAGAL